MDEQKISLALAYLQSQPESAARILEQNEIQAVTRFVAETPVTYTTPLFARMSPYFIARICKRMDKSAAVNKLSPLDASLIAAILRYLNQQDREIILAEFPVRIRSACSLLLRFSQSTVGAWMTPHVVIIPDDCIVEEALNTISTGADIFRTSYVFALDRGRYLQGRIHYTELLRASPTQPVITMLDGDCPTLSGRMSLHQAAEHADWAGNDVLPVLSRNGKFIGVLRHADLRRGLEQHAVRVDQQPDKDPLSGILDAYGHSLAALFETLGDTVAMDTRNRE